MFLVIKFICFKENKLNCEVSVKLEWQILQLKFSTQNTSSEVFLEKIPRTWVQRHVNSKITFSHCFYVTPCMCVLCRQRLIVCGHRYVGRVVCTSRVCRVVTTRRVWSERGTERRRTASDDETDGETRSQSGSTVEGPLQQRHALCARTRPECWRQFLSAAHVWVCLLVSLCVFIIIIIIIIIMVTLWYTQGNLQSVLFLQKRT